MKRSEDYRKLYESSFRDDAVWLDWMMRQIYSDSDLMLLDDESGTRTVSAMLLRSYGWRYFGTNLDMAYIFGACTLPRYRSHGYMGRLIDESLRRALERGDALCTLIPATASLYDYYERFGFARAVYIDRERYTALHHFDTAQGYGPRTAEYSDFNRLESESDNTVLHSPGEYRNIIDDLHLDGGDVFAVGRDDGPVNAMAFAVAHREIIHVKALYAHNNMAKNAVLALVRRKFGEQMVVVDCFVDSRKRALQPRGMVRLLDVYQLLNAMAASEPSLQCTLQVPDDRIAGNSDRFTIADGICRRGGDTPDLDVDIDTLTRILGSSEATGRIMGLRATHYRLPLMLD